MLEGPLIWPGAREVILQLATSGEDVALIAADLRLPGMDGVAFLERAQELHRQASRVLLLTMDRYHTRLPFTESATLQQATALGRIDFWIVKGWVTPEESLYPQVQEALSAWTITHRPHHVMYRIVGEQWVPRSHDLRETLSRNGVPFAFYPVDSPQGQQLLRDFSVDPAGLPALIRHDGSVLHNPSFADIASAHGIEVQPADQVYDLAILGARAGRAGSCRVRSIRARRWKRGRRSRGDPCHRCDLPPPRYCRPGALRRYWSVLWRGQRGSAGTGRARGVRRRRSELRRPGSSAPREVRQPGYLAGPWAVTGRGHVRLPHQAAGGDPKP